MKAIICSLAAVSVLGALEAFSATVFVWAGSQSPTPPYADWTTAAHQIQDAVDAAADWDRVLVTNGVYATGGRTVKTNLLFNRVVIEKAVRLESVNGAAVTVIEGAPSPTGDPHGNGDGAVRCLYLESPNAIVSGFTLTKGHTRTAGDVEAEQGGGGARCLPASALVENCVLTANAAGWGGGVYDGTLRNCTLFGNWAHFYGGGAYGTDQTRCTLNNCTVSGNSADTGGGASWCALNNCILYYNTAQLGPNYFYATLNYCCTTPLPSSGFGNISLDPQLASTSHLSANSPCRRTGSASYVSGVDIDGETWGDVPSIGCDEYYEGAVTGPLHVSVLATFTNAAVGSPLPFTALVEGRTTGSLWDFGDGTVVSNQPYASHAWLVPGDYSLVFRAYNETAPGGENASVTVRVTTAPVHYVAADSINPAAPYTSWATAARNIQDAVDVAAPGAVVMVTNGVYNQGGRVVVGTMTNRVAVDKQLTLQSVNGPQLTIIQGCQVPNTVNGVGAMRCVYLAGGAVLSGFTLTLGATSKSAGDWYGEESGGGAWCQSLDVVITNCILSGNSASFAGGGVYGGTLNNCTLSNNAAKGDNGSKNSIGGGACNSTLINCVATGNRAEGEFGSGGGAVNGSLYGCTITGNSAVSEGGGVYGSCTLNNCTLAGNSAGGYGGGARGDSSLSCKLYNCLLVRNSAGSGGGASGSRLVNCTLTGNSVDHLDTDFAYSGGGVSFCSLSNCLVYYNTAVWGSANYDPGSSLGYCCTTPMPPTGPGNITFEPQLASASHLSANSPCRGAGNAQWSVGSDIDGEPWADAPSIGCDEYLAGAVAGALKVAIEAAVTNAAVGSELSFTALIDGRASVSVWDFDDGTTLSNRPYASHTWTVPGDYAVGLRAYNDSQPGGVGVTVSLHVPGKLTHYVAATGTNPVPPFTSWSTAATNVQDAVDAAMAGDEILVADGIYAAGGRVVGASLVMNRVAVTNLLTLRSVNGPEFTIIQGAKAAGETNGDGAVRCVYLANGASLSGFTLTNGATRAVGELETEQPGGGAWCESTAATLSNCVLVANSAVYGGGVYRGALFNCVLSGNSATGDGYGGGGAYQSTMYNCTVTDNSATWAGGGVSRGTLYNSIVYYNIAPMESNYLTSFLDYCCTMPLPTNGVGNAPLFVDGTKRNLHLKSGSPCINAGNNAYVASSKDYDGNPRLVNGAVDIGAYEYQGSGSVISYAWLQQYGFPTDGSVDFVDSDGDGLSNWQEWRANTNPTNALSALRMLAPSVAIPGISVRWQSVSGQTYFLKRGTNLAVQSPFDMLATNIVGQTGTTVYADTNAAGTGPFFYRVGVQ